MKWGNYASYLDWLLAQLGPDASLVPGLALIKRQIESYNACASAAQGTRERQGEQVSTIADQADGMSGNQNPFGVGIVGPDPNSDPEFLPGQATTGAWTFLFVSAWATLTYHNNMQACASQNPLASLGR